jgi:plastocyanin
MTKRMPRLSAAVVLAMLGGVLLLGGSRGLVGAQDGGDGASPPRPSHIHSGDCDELGPIIRPLTSLAVPGDDVGGNPEAVVAEAAFSSIPETLDELLAEDHAIKVHLSQERIETYLACGDLGGAVDANGALIVGLKELDGSGWTGIAYLQPAGDGTTSVSVMIAKVLPGGGAGDAAASQDEAAEAAAEDEAAADGPNVVGVALTEFAIQMPTELPAGPTQFNVSNVGAAQHNFVIQGEGVDQRLAEESLGPRQSASIDLDLAPGTYTVFCPVGQGAHRANGMEVTLTVQ